MSLIEAIKRPFRGSPKFESIPQEQAFEAARDNLQEFATALSQIPKEVQIEKFLPKDETWKLIYNLGAAAAILYEECPQLPPSPQQEWAVGQLNELIQKESEGEDTQDLTLPRSLTGAGFDVKYKPEELDLPSPYNEFSKTIRQN